VEAAAGGLPRQRYSAGELLALAASSPSAVGRALELPADLHSGVAQVTEAASKQQRRSYSLQALLELSEGAGKLLPSGVAALRGRLPPELLEQPPPAGLEG
jgi:hypothetical protein